MSMKVPLIDTRMLTTQKHDPHLKNIFFAYLMDDVPKHSQQNIYRWIGVGRPS